MEIFSIGQETVSDDKLRTNPAHFVRLLEGALAADKLVVHRDDLAVDDGVTEGAPAHLEMTAVSRPPLPT